MTTAHPAYAMPSYAHPPSTSSPHYSSSYPFPYQPPLFDVSPILYPPTPVRDSSGSASLFSHPDDPSTSASVSAYLASLSSPSLSSSSVSPSPLPSSPSASSLSYPPSSTRFEAPHLLPTSSLAHPPKSSHPHPHDFYPAPSHVQAAPYWGPHPSAPIPHPSPLSPRADGLFPTDGARSSPAAHSAASQLHPPPPSSPSIHPPSSSSPSHDHSLPHPRKRKGHLHQRKIACNVCHLAKTSCDGQRPCSRCVRLAKTARCVDRPSKVPRMEAGGVMTGIPVPVYHVGVGVVNGAPVPVAAVAPSPTEAKAGEGSAGTPQGGKVRDEDDDCEECTSSSEEGVDSGVSDDEDASASSSADGGEEDSVDVQLSRALLKSHISWGEKQRRSNPQAVGLRKMDMREKLIYYTWLSSMMRPQHVEELLHQSIANDNAEWERKRDETHQTWMRLVRAEREERKEAAREERKETQGEDGAGEAATSDSASASQPSGSPSASPKTKADGQRKGGAYVPCDGSVCNDFCPSARQWAAMNPCSFTWHMSPEQSMADGASPLNDYPIMVIRDLSDQRVCLLQNKAIIFNIMRKEAEVKAREHRRKASAASPASSPEDSSPMADAAAEVDAGDVAVKEEAKEAPPSRLGMRQLLEDCADCSLSPADEVAMEEAQRLLVTPASSNTALVLSNASGSTSSAPPALPFAPSSSGIEVPMWCQVNSAFERLTGYSQAELRQHLLRDGVKSLYHLTRRDGWERLMELEQEATFGTAHEYRTYAVVVNKYHSEVHCLLHTKYVYGDDGRFSETRTTFIPLPDPKPPAMGEGGGGRGGRDRRKGKGKGKDRTSRSRSRGRRKDSHGRS